MRIDCNQQYVVTNRGERKRHADNVPAMWSLSLPGEIGIFLYHHRYFGNIDSAGIYNYNLMSVESK